jgi:SAM-dependent methyltransferase
MFRNRRCFDVPQSFVGNFVKARHYNTDRKKISMLANPIARLEADIKPIVDSQGLSPEQYDQLTSWYNRVGELRSSGVMSDEDLFALRSFIGESYGDAASLQGNILHKPFGYAGDFSIIDSFYTRRCSCLPKLRKWDLYVQSLEAVDAVRNRKEFFKRTFSLLAGSMNKHRRASMLNVASGPCRDLFEAFENNPDANLDVHCLDADVGAIDFARQLTLRYSERITFEHQNVLKFRPEQSYNLIWSAGLFDYLSDRVFVRLVRQMSEWLEPGGSIVIGNFSTVNPSRHPMEFCDWFLNYRSEDDLVELATKAGCSKENIAVEAEPCGINLFLRLTRPLGVSKWHAGHNVLGRKGSASRKVN